MIAGTSSDQPTPRKIMFCLCLPAGGSRHSKGEKPASFSHHSHHPHPHPHSQHHHHHHHPDHPDADLGGSAAGVRPPVQQRRHDDVPSLATRRQGPTRGDGGGSGDGGGGGALRSHPHHLPPPVSVPEQSPVFLTRVQDLLPRRRHPPPSLLLPLRGGRGRGGRECVRGVRRCRRWRDGLRRRGWVVVAVVDVDAVRLLQATSSVVRGGQAFRGRLCATPAATAATAAATAATSTAATAAA